MVTNEHDVNASKAQVISGSQTARPASWWDKTPERSRTAASSRVIQKQYDRQRVTSANPYRIVDEKHSSGLRTRSALIKQRRDREKNAFRGYDLDNDGYIDNNEIVISKHLDLDNDGKLDANERARALKDPKLLSNLSFGHDKNLTSDFRTIQVNGKVVNTLDWSAEANNTEIVDRYLQKLEESDRRSRRSPAMTRSQKMSQELLDRQKKEPGFGYIESPKFRTRSELKRAQKRAFLCERANNAFDGSKGTNAGLLSKKINILRSTHARF